MHGERISIIIPVYNVERFLDKCLTSVLQQSYRELEVLLVDDGSTDSSGLLCDHWAEKDPRVRVIHKENGGLSDARNVGLDSATGNYINFIDSDDYIAEDIIKKLYDALIAYDADMSICNFLTVDEDGVTATINSKPLPIKNELISGHDALERSVTTGWYYTVAWNKLYKKNLFSEIRFPKGKIHEDLFVAHKLLDLCKRIACISDVGYYYLQRSDSLLNSNYRAADLHAAEAYLCRALYFEHCYLEKCAGKSFWRSALCLSDACAKIGNNPDFQEELRETLQSIRQNIGLRSNCTKKEALQITLISFSPFFYYLVFRNPLRQKIKTIIH